MRFLVAMQTGRVIAARFLFVCTNLRQNTREDFMGKTMGRALLALIAALLVWNWFGVGRAKANPQIAYGQSACRSYAPTSWGEYLGSSKDYGVVFKDNAGTLRFITNVACETTPQVALEIRRGNPPN